MKSQDLIIASGGHGYVVVLNVILGVPIFLLFSFIFFSMLGKKKFKKMPLLLLYFILFVPMSFMFVAMNTRELGENNLNIVCLMAYIISSIFMVVKALKQYSQDAEH